MDQPPRPRARANDESLVGSIRTFEPTISCVLPWQGCAAALSSLVLPLLDDVSALAQLWELVLVDHGCSATDAVAMAAWSQVEGIRIVRLAGRVGRDAAIATGLQLANGDLIVVLQGDDARASELIAGLLVKWRQGFDVVHSTEPQVSESIAARWARQLRPDNTTCAPSAQFASMRTAHQALLMDRSAIRYFASPHARATESSTLRPGRCLRIAAVPTPPVLAAKRSCSSVGGLDAVTRCAPAVLRATDRWFARWCAGSSTDAEVENLGECGHGLAPRTPLLAAYDSGSNRPALPHD